MSSFFVHPADGQHCTCSAKLIFFLVFLQPFYQLTIRLTSTTLKYLLLSIITTIITTTYICNVLSLVEYMYTFTCQQVVTYTHTNSIINRFVIDFENDLSHGLTCGERAWLWWRHAVLHGTVWPVYRLRQYSTIGTQTTDCEMLHNRCVRILYLQSKYTELRSQI